MFYHTMAFTFLVVFVTYSMALERNAFPVFSPIFCKCTNKKQTVNYASSFPKTLPDCSTAIVVHTVASQPASRVDYS